MASLYEQYLGNNRDYVYNTLGKYADQAGTNATADRTKAMGYRDVADAAYQPILDGNGGYLPNERQQIIGADRLDQMQLSPQDENSAYLSPEEAMAIQGDPNARATYFNPGGDLTATEAEQGRARGIAQEGVRGSLGYATQAKEIADPSKLVQSQDFVDRYRMTPEQVQEAATTAARDSTTVDQAAMERAREAGTASGMDPLGMASYLNRANRSSQQDAARSASAARVQAQREQAARELAIETNRQQAQGVATGTQLGALDTGYKAYADAHSQVLKDEEQGNQIAQQQRQFNTTKGTDIAAAQQDQATTGAKTVATNRQGVNLQNRNDVYNRQQYADTQTARRTAGVADTRMAQEKEARGYVTGQGNTQDTLAQQEYDRQLKSSIGANGAIQQNLQLQKTEDTTPNKPSWWEKLLNAGVQAASGFAGG